MPKIEVPVTLRSLLIRLQRRLPLRAGLPLRPLLGNGQQFAISPCPSGGSRS